jgi:RNA-directed DNA polymerase
MAYRFHKLAPYVRGWMGYFGISDYYRPIPEIDQWLRRRVRMCYWKQGRYVRTKVKNLLSLGASKRQAILTAISSKSYRHLSRTLATQTGMTNPMAESPRADLYSRSVDEGPWLCLTSSCAPFS